MKAECQTEYQKETETKAKAGLSVKLSIFIKQIQPTVIWREGKETVAKAVLDKADHFQINWEKETDREAQTGQRRESTEL